jgi:hypothetical protein
VIAFAVLRAVVPLALAYIRLCTDDEVTAEFVGLLALMCSAATLLFLVATPLVLTAREHRPPLPALGFFALIVLGFRRLR